MNTNDKRHGATLTLVEAVETLSNIADLQFDHEAEIARRHDRSVEDQPLTAHTVHWLRHQGAGITIHQIKQVFRVILKHLQDFYKNKHVDNASVSNIKTIMVLVGEAAHKLDKYTMLFYKNQPQSIKELKEYKKLQEFYLNRIAKQIDSETIGKWILALSHKKTDDASVKLKGLGSRQMKHIFIDLESVKKDSEYELFFLKKEDGTRFFSPRLIRNIKLITDFGSSLKEEQETETFFGVEEWYDKVACECARNIIHSIKGYIERFYRMAGQAKDQDLVIFLHKALIALMMAANPYHLMRRSEEVKSCRHYFHDFQLFFRRCLRATEYQKLMAYPPENTHKLACCLLDLLHVLGMAFYTQLTGIEEIIGKVAALIDQATEKLSAGHKDAAQKGRLSLKLAGEYEAMTRWFKGHAAGPLNRVLSMLQDGDCHQFDPILQGDLPSVLYALYVQEKRCLFARWPSPTYQSFIHKAAVNEEFKAFLNACGHGKEMSKVLMFNFQDRVTWKEHFRSSAIEDLPEHESFAKHIDVVTLAKDTEFYYQQAPYLQQCRADVFIGDFKQQFEDENGGFSIPDSIKQQLFSRFIPDALGLVHRIFFAEKEMLTREERQDFIEIFYLLLQLKVIEVLKPNVVGFSCKDGLDVTCSASVELFCFLKLLNQERLSENDQEYLDLMLYGPCLMVRERVMIPERFHRMLNVIKAIEQVRGQYGQAGFAAIIQDLFGRLYETPILKGKVVMQRSKDIL